MLIGIIKLSGEAIKLNPYNINAATIIERIAFIIVFFIYYSPSQY